MDKTKTVMIVDDEPDILATTKEILNANNYKTIRAKDGHECLEKLKAKIPDVILLDIMMPCVTAKEVIEEISKKEKYSKIKIIYVTAGNVSDMEEKKLLKPKQIVGFITKPFDLKEMIKEIKNAID